MKLTNYILIGFFMFCSANVSAEKHTLETMTFKNPGQPTDKVITGGQPSLSDIDNLKKLGVVNIINLRTSDEFDEFNESQEADKRGFKYLSLEISGADGITVDNALQLDKLLKSVDGISFLHCASSNRVGALLAIREFVVNGKTKEEALIFGKTAGLSSLYNKTESLLDSLPAQ